MHATVQQIEEFFLCDLKLLIPSGKGYCAALNYVFSLAGVNLADNTVISRMFDSFEKFCPPWEIRPPE